MTKSKAKKGQKTTISPRPTATKASRGPSLSPDSKSANPDVKSIRTLADLRRNYDLWCKICVLIYDLKHMAKDGSCENRTLQTTDALYISGPYFSDEEAVVVKAAVVDDTTEPKLTVERAITRSLESFLEKRRASGDSRPCGPHDLVLVYLLSFGITKLEIEDEKFVSRVKRSGLQTSQDVEGMAAFQSCLPGSTFQALGVLLSRL